LLSAVTGALTGVLAGGNDRLRGDSRRVSADTAKLSASSPKPAAELSAATRAPPRAGPAKTASCVLADSSALPLCRSSSVTSVGMIA